MSEMTERAHDWLNGRDAERSRVLCLIDSTEDDWRALSCDDRPDVPAVLAMLRADVESGREP